MSLHRVSTTPIFYIFIIALTGQPALASGLAIELGLGNAISRNATTTLNDNFIDNNTLAQARANKSRQAWQTTLRYDFSNRLQARIGYVELGPLDTSLVGETTEINIFLSSNPNIPLNSVSGWLTSIAYQYTLNNIVNLRAKVGLYAWQASYSLRGADFYLQFEDSGAGPSLGFDLGIKLSSHFTGRIGWEIYEIATEKTDFLSVAIEFH